MEVPELFVTELRSFARALNRHPAHSAQPALGQEAS
jgi:hypothetical protein